jgi:hypothetical protein
MTKHFFFLLIITTLIHIEGKAQSNDLFFDLTSGGGRLTPHHAELKNLAGPVSFINARLGLKTFGKKEWQREYNYPEIGIGISHNYLTSKSLGNPTAVYSFMNLPLLPDKKFKLAVGVHLGFAWGFNPSTDQNQVNLAIGSKCTAYFSLNLNSQFRISQNFDLLLSAGGYHYSNGNMMKPNKGINLLGAETGIRYTVRNSDKIRNTDPVSPIEKNSSVIVFGSWGWKKEVTHATGFPISSFSAGYYKTVSHKSRLSTGFDLFIDEDVLYFTQKENLIKNKLAAGLFVGHELTFNHFSIVSQLGIYIRNPNPNDPFYYERLGLRYVIAKRIIPSVTLKAHDFKVDFIEWGLGFVLWKS